MRTATVILIVLILFCVWPQYLYSFDTVPGRIVLITIVVYLAQANPLLGLVAAIMTARVLDQKASPAAAWHPTADRMRIEMLMRPKASFHLPALRTTQVPVNDPFNQYTIY
jgi:hypothetical protein